MTRKQACFRWALLAAATLFSLTAATTQAQVLLDTDFTEAEGFVAGNLQFQNGFLGQAFAQVDPTGTGTVIGPAEPNPGMFPFGRNVFSQGATGGVAGNAGTLTTGGFTAGDQISIQIDYQFDLIENAADASGTFNTELADVGFREGFGNTEGFGFGFDAVPQQGFDAMFNIFGTGIGGEENQGGTLQVFPDFNAARTGESGIFIPGRDIGLNPNGAAVDVDGVAIPGGVDLSSDLLRFSYLAETDGAGNFTVEAFSVENLATAQVFTFDAETNPQSFQYLASVDTTAAANGGVAAGDPAPDAFLGFLPSPNAVPGFELVIDSLRFEFITEIVSPVGDYNGDGSVDAADYTIWRDTLGQLGAGLAADGDGDGDVDTDDYNLWVANFGSGGASASAVTAAPEPAAALLMIVGGMALVGSRARASAKG